MPKRLWRLLREPRRVTAIFGIMWLIIIGLGVSALTVPPVSITTHLGHWTTAWAAFMLLGGPVGFFACVILRTPPWWRWLERIGIVASGFGVAIYLAMIVWIQLTAVSGSRLVQLLFVCLAGLLLMVRGALLHYDLIPIISRGSAGDAA